MCILEFLQPTTNDNFGGRNNVINVKKSDFEVFQALESDASASIGSAGSISEYHPLLGIIRRRNSLSLILLLCGVALYQFSILGLLNGSSSQS